MPENIDLVLKYLINQSAHKNASLKKKREILDIIWRQLYRKKYYYSKLDRKKILKEEKYEIFKDSINPKTRLPRKGFSLREHVKKLVAQGHGRNKRFDALEIKVQELTSKSPKTKSDEKKLADVKKEIKIEKEILIKRLEAQISRDLKRNHTEYRLRYITEKTKDIPPGPLSYILRSDRAPFFKALNTIGWNISEEDDWDNFMK